MWSLCSPNDPAGVSGWPSDHAVKGPRVTAAKLSRADILEALVDPQAKLTEGYGLLVGKLKDGTDVSGSIVKSSDSHYQIRTAEGNDLQVERKNLASEVLTSQMPPMGAILTRYELRDIVEFLSNLR